MGQADSKTKEAAAMAAEMQQLHARLSLNADIIRRKDEQLDVYYGQVWDPPLRWPSCLSLWALCDKSPKHHCCEARFLFKSKCPLNTQEPLARV